MHQHGVRTEAPAPSREIDTTVPHSARVYDYWLGGKDNFAADRALAEKITDMLPVLPAKVRANRAFLGRAVSYMAREEGISQFLDIGSGLPTARNTHQVAREATPGSRVLYVDNDPIVVAHSRALMSDNGAGHTGFLQADLRDPEAILASPAVARTLDLDQPVGLLLLAVLMFLPDTADPYGIVATLMGALPSGSCLAASHLTADFNPAGVAGLVRASEADGAPVVARSHAETEKFFSGLEIVPPGVVQITAWRADEGASPDDPAGDYAYAGVGSKR
jgi:S-adenosyl methyltransferase